MNSIKFKCPECGQALTFNDILHVETIDEIKNTLCPYCKMLISKEEITRQIQSNVARRIEAMLGGLKQPFVVQSKERLRNKPRMNMSADSDLKACGSNKRSPQCHSGVQV